VSHRNTDTGVRDRWMAEITCNSGRQTRLVAFQEIEDLDPIVERGPDWHEIEHIVVTLNQTSRHPRGARRRAPEDDR
jgi:hypothetical protein